MGAGCSVGSWRLVAERGVSPAVVVVRLPVADHLPRLSSDENMLMGQGLEVGARAESESP